MRMIAAEGRGVLVLIREPLSVQMALSKLHAGHAVEAPTGELRDYGVGAQILIDLGVREMVLLTNTKKNLVGVGGFALRIVGQRPIPTTGLES
jgi:3,4-dihydroxy 2-butanone 4-phosphate synthase/GTP cyclohydrolase II